MKNANKEITVYNHYLDASTGYDLWKRTNIQNVSVFAQTKVTVDKDGVSSGDVYTIRIPQNSPQVLYLRPANFQAQADKSRCFTLNKEDIIVLGYADDENPRPGELEKKYGAEYVVTVTGVTDNRDKREPHWKVIGQ